MKLKQLLEYGSFMKRSKPSTEKLDVPLSAYGNQPLTTFNKNDQASAMNFWKDLLSKFPKKQKLHEEIQGTSYSEQEIINMFVNHVEEMKRNFELEGLDFEIERIEIYGSRSRNQAKDDSDLDIKLYYRGSAREDDMFNAFHRDENILEIDGLPVDVNPININI